jgi:hypothetical protein
VNLCDYWLLSAASHTTPAVGLSANHFGRKKVTLHLDLSGMADFVPSHISATPMVAGFQAAPERKQQAVIDELISRFEALIQPDCTHRIPFSSYFVRALKSPFIQ